ncbi:MAG: anion permease [Chitinophagales bacterium]
MDVVILLTVLFLAYANGANDNFKGVSTLFGSGTSSYNVAINWGTVSTLAGSIYSIYLAQGLLLHFSGKGIITDGILTEPALNASIALGAATTVFLATRIGIPISTTHAIIGALVGAGYMAASNAIDVNQLIEIFILPILVSPFIGCIASIILYIILKQLRLRLKMDKNVHFVVQRPIQNLQYFARPAFSIERKANEKYTGDIAEISARSMAHVLHFISAGAVGFARGMNDTPKIAGLLLLVSFMKIPYMLLGVAIAMAIGGLFNAKRVGITMSKKITDINPGQGFTTNIITAVLVWYASISALPVSTTHISVGGIFGIGVINRKADYTMVRKIVSAWILTLPIAAIITACIFFILQHL